MDNQKYIIASLAMDLKRVSLGLQRGSLNTANRFREEALKRGEELEKTNLNEYLKKLLRNARQVLKSDDERVAEDVLMYSTLFENFAQKELL